MKILLLIFCLISLTPSYGQDCDLPGGFCVDCGEVKAAWKGKESLTDYFRHNIKSKDVTSIHGPLVIQLLIDSAGNVCCKSFSNNTKFELSEPMLADFRRVVNNMPQWSPAIDNGKPTNVSNFLIVVFNESAHYIVDMYRIDTTQMEFTDPKKDNKE